MEIYLLSRSHAEDGSEDVRAFMTVEGLKAEVERLRRPIGEVQPWRGTDEAIAEARSQKGEGVPLILGLWGGPQIFVAPVEDAADHD